MQTVRPSSHTSLVCAHWVFVGVGSLFKCNFLIVVVGLVVAALSIPQYRSLLFDRRTLVSVAIAAAVILPHVSWIFRYHGSSGIPGWHHRKLSIHSRRVNPIRGWTIWCMVYPRWESRSLPAAPCAWWFSLFFLFAKRHRVTAADNSIGTPLANC